MSFGFSALFARMNYIDRWGLMRNARKESLSEHSAIVSGIAHVLAVSAREMFGADDVRPEHVATAALYHDLAETLTGDMPTPVKYRNESIRTSYKAVEREAEDQILLMLPEPLRDEIGICVKGTDLTDRERLIIKAADKLSALLKCIEEKQSGNMEFVSAEKSTMESLRKMDLPELKYFISEFLPAYYQTLDELLGKEL